MTPVQLVWQAITPVHVGTGQDSSGVIDLPVAREAGTRYPCIPASSIKGVFRDGEDLDVPAGAGPLEITTARRRFGHADVPILQGDKVVKVSGIGDLTFTDARLLCLPVPSFRGTYSLVTCPLVLQRLARDRTLLGLATDCEVPTVPDGGVLVTGDRLVFEKKVILNDLDFVCSRNTTLGEAWKVLTDGLQPLQGSTERLCLVGDDVFGFLCETALEVTTHIRLKSDTKTVKEGGLWYQENLPAETLLTSFLISAKDDFGVLTGRTWLQLGGKSTTGQGMMALHVRTPGGAR